MYTSRIASTRQPGQRAGLDHAAVLAAARALITAEGFDGLTMRRLARRLDVAPNALYSHVANKTALVDAILDDVLADIDPAIERERDPVAALHALMSSTYELLLAHRDLVPLYLARQGARGPNAQGLGDVMLALLGQMSVHGATARQSVRVLIVYTIGFAAFTVSPAIDAGDGDGDGDGAAPPSAELERNFAGGLDWLLAGIASAAALGPAPSPG